MESELQDNNILHFLAQQSETFVKRMTPLEAHSRMDSHSEDLVHYQLDFDPHIDE